MKQERLNLLIGVLNYNLMIPVEDEQLINNTDKMRCDKKHYIFKGAEKV